MASKTDNVNFTDRWDFATIDDFSKGIYSKGSPSGNSVVAPLGSAQVTNTYRCYAGKNGELQPLPANTATYNLPNPDVIGNLIVGYYNISGFFVFGPVGPPSSNASGAVDDVFVGVEWLKSGGTREFRYYRLNMDTVGVPVDTLETIHSTQNPTLEQYRGMSFTASRINPTSPYIVYGTPVVVGDWAPPGFAADKHIIVFPNPSSPGTTSVVDLASNRVGSVIGHQNRIIILEDVTNQFGGGSGDAIPTNEQISFTDPPNSNVLGTQQEVFVQEFPNGFGTWGSISAGELFLIKHQGGGLIVTGDVANPQITRLPGVVSCGGTGSRAASSVNGLIYYSRFNGCYIWRGADTSTKISNNLDDQFLWYSNGPDKLLSQNICFQEWGDWVLATNNYLFDTNTEAWWRLDDPSSVGIYQWFGRSFFSETVYAVPVHYTPSTLNVMQRYTKTVPATSYSWQSHPVPVSVNRVIDVREIVLVAMGTGTVAVTITGLDSGSPSSVTETFTIFNTSQPQRLRLLTQCRGYNIIARIVSTGAITPAPTVFELSLGYRDQVFATTT